MKKDEADLGREAARWKMAAIVCGAVAVLAVAASVVIWTRFSTLRPVVTVGNHAISKRDYEAVLEEDAGKKVLTQMVYAEIVRQAATKAGAMPSKAEVDARMAAIARVNPASYASAEQNGSLDELRGEAESSLAMQNLQMKDVQVTDADIAAYYASHQRLFHQNGQAKAQLVMTDTAEDAQSARQLLQQGMTSEALAQQPAFHVVGTNYAMTAAEQAAARKELGALSLWQAGRVGTLPCAGKFLTVRITSRTPARTLPLSAVRSQVITMAKLSKAVPLGTELVRLYDANKPVFNMPEYSNYFADIAKAGGR